MQSYLADDRPDDPPADTVVLDYCGNCEQGPSGCVTRLRQRFPGIGLVMLCADLSVPRDGKVAGLVDAFFYKPTAPRALVRTIADLTGAR